VKSRNLQSAAPTTGKETSNAYRMVTDTLLRKHIFERPERRWKDNIKINFMAISSEGWELTGTGL
jgi:predicted KAP-like P-loop ATPase